MEIRGWDKQGCGAYGASRGGRKHNGVDIVVEEGDQIRAFRAGIVSKIGYPYNPNDSKKGHYRYVEVAVGSRRHRYFYVEPGVRKGESVEAGQVIGKAQGLTKLYPGITDHIHFEIKLDDGSFIDPTNLVKSINNPKDLPFRAKMVKGIILIYRRTDGGFFSTMSKTIAEAAAFIELQIKNMGDEFDVRSLSQIDWTEVTNAAHGRD